jgi:hypothetical protein
MASGPDHIFEFRAAVEKNRQIFSLQHAYAHFAFFGICEGFESIGKRLQIGRDRNSKSHVSLVPFVLLMERQSMNAFELLSTYRSYEAWVLIRPALEAALYMGKWVDDPENAAIWSTREDRRTEYIKTFTGKALVSQSLPRAPEINAVLTRLNDEFMHANEPYYTRHITAERLSEDEIFLGVEYFDTEEDVEPHALAFLHLLAVLRDSVESMLATLLTGTGPYTAQAPKLATELASRASQLRIRDAKSEKTLRELGLWFVVPGLPNP